MNTSHLTDNLEYLKLAYISSANTVSWPRRPPAKRRPTATT